MSVKPPMTGCGTLGRRSNANERGTTRFLRSGNGPESSRRGLLKWIADQRIEAALIVPSKPWQNGVSGTFNGKFREESLSLAWFLSRAQAKVVIAFHGFPAEHWKHLRTTNPDREHVLGRVPPTSRSKD